jgi:hypothetical protein
MNMETTRKDFIEKMDAALSRFGEKVLRKSVSNFSYYYNIGFIGFKTKSGRSLSYDRHSGIIKDIDIWNDINHSYFTMTPDKVDQPTWIKLCAEAHAAADKASFVAKC